MEQTDIYNSIIETYKQTGSVKKTAEELGTSVIRVRRVLITEELWSSPTSLKIKELYDQGLSKEQIAEQLHYTIKNVEAFLPYKRGAYGCSQSTDSQYSKEYRARNHQAAESQVGSSENAPKEYIRPEELVTDDALTGRPIALKVHLELNLGECSPQDLKVLRKHGKINKAISRDILVPADITLHSLHYVIQKLFGWQNSHLHHYAFPEDIFDKLTEGKLTRWFSLAGIYFRFPTEELDDLYWDDDYEPNMSVKSWLKSKYRGPYQYGGLGDYYMENQREVHMLKEQLPTFEVRESFEELMKKKLSLSTKKKKRVSLEKATVDEFRRSVDLGGDLDHLLERLTLMEYLYLPNNTYFLDDINEKIRFLEDELDVTMGMWYNALENIEEQYEVFCLLAATSTVRMQAQSHEIKYFYDYGDGWEVSISIAEAYYKKDLKMDAESDLFQVLRNYTPICLEADGLPVLDDVGGVGGYLDFLRTIHNSEDEAEKEQAREWARSLGWTGRMIKPKNIL